MYGPGQSDAPGDVGAQNVVVREQVDVADLLGRLREGAHAARVRADLGLGEDDAELHVRIIPESDVSVIIEGCGASCRVLTGRVAACYGLEPWQWPPASPPSS